jgi:futalosine hydrolase
MKILIVAPAQIEIAPFLSYLDKQFERKSFFEYERKDMHLFPFITGYGMMQSAYALGKLEIIKDMDFVICAGLCATVTRVLDLGQVVNVHTEIFGDFGREEHDGTLTDIHDLQLIDPNLYPFRKAKLTNEQLINPLKYKVVNGMTVNKILGSTESIERMNYKYHADIESFEGLAYAYACMMQHMPFMHIRAISQFVEPMASDSGDLDLAIDNLNEALIRFINYFEEHPFKKDSLA